ncbi:MAG: GDSL-type esterase/lipase family protein [Actinomycetota bacterium]|nr:GDSL-type esterase/lipase family protein [Actinomycetota bacterium]
MPTEPKHSDDNLMERFDRDGARRFRARDALVAVAIIAAILVVTSGASIRKAGEQMNSGVARAAVLDVGRPAGWIADHLPLRSATHTLTAWLSPDPNLNGLSGFNESIATGATVGIPSVTPDAFDPSQIGAAPAPRKPLHTLLVTGDSMSEPLDQYLAQSLAPGGEHVIQDPHIGTGISSTVLVDWAKLSTFQVQHDHPDAVVVFIGANDGYSMPGPNGKLVNCCSAEWAAIYAGRARRMMNTYRQAGTARVYWLTLPTPRDNARAKIALVVNAAIQVAAEPWRDQIRVVDTVPVFTPGNRYRDSMTINGAPTIVRQSDGIHLNNPGSTLAAKIVLAAADKDFTR